MVAACGGGGTSAPTAPTAPGVSVSSSSTAMATSVTFGGKVTNIVTGTPAVGATVTIGSVSTTSEADGSYSLAVTASGQQSLSMMAAGYHTRKSAVSMSGATTINLEIIPVGDGFDLAFFDHSFRDGSNGTTRWLTQPPFEIWTQLFRCVDPCTGNQQYEATAESVPTYFETRAREAIALVSDLTGGAMVNPVITTKTHAVGTRVAGDGGGGNSIRFMYANKFNNSAEGGRTWNSPGSEVALTGSHLSFNQSHGSPGRDNSIYIHELAHAVGFIPGHTANLGLVPGPSIMGPDPVVVTAKDRLHVKTLYKRPIGNTSPDSDPVGAILN